MYIFSFIGLMCRVIANGRKDLGSIPGRVIPKTQNMVLDASLLNTQHYKLWIKGKVEQSIEQSLRLLLHLGVVAIEKRSFRVTLYKGRQLFIILYIYFFSMI